MTNTAINLDKLLLGERAYKLCKEIKTKTSFSVKPDNSEYFLRTKIHFDRDFIIDSRKYKNLEVTTGILLEEGKEYKSTNVFDIEEKKLLYTGSHSQEDALKKHIQRVKSLMKDYIDYYLKKEGFDFQWKG